MIINGKELAKIFLEDLKKEISNLKVIPTFQIIQVGDIPASCIYVNNKIKIASDLNIKARLIKLKDSCTENDIISEIIKANKDTEIHGVMVQLPIPNHLNSNKIINTIDPYKDIDGLTLINQGKLFCGMNSLTSCTPLGIIRMIKSVEKNLSGKHAVIIGRSLIVGKPLIHLLLQENCSVSVVHSKSKGIHNITKQADILIVAIGKANFIDSSFVKPGSIVIDVGISKINNKTTGDVKFDEVSKIAYAISPVPGGVGPMTIATLMHNIVLATKNHQK